MAHGKTELPGASPPGEANNPNAVHKWWVLICIGIGTFMSALDGSVVNTLLPVIGRALEPQVQAAGALTGAQVAAVEWVVTVYLLVLSGLLLGFGRLGDLRGHKQIYIAGFVVFMISSALCGTSRSITALIIYRSVQAVGGAMLAANSPAILTKSFPSNMRGRALGMQATMTYLGLTVGPSLGGWLADWFSWRAVFYINIPIVLLAIALSLRFIPNDHQHNTMEGFDWRGALVFMAGLVSLLFGLNQGHALGWTSPMIVGLLVGAILLLIWFVKLEQKQPNPMLDLSLFSSRTFSASVASAIFNYICVYSIMFLLPYYLIQGLEFSTSRSGLVLSTMPLVMAAVAPISGSLSDKIGPRTLSVAGMILLCLGLILLAGLGPDTTFIQIALPMMVCGTGIGFFISPNNSALMGSAPKRRQGIAAGVMATARNIGMVLGIGITGAIFTTGLAQTYTSGAGTLFNALRTSFLFAAGFAALGAITSLVRGNGVSNDG